MTIEEVVAMIQEEDRPLLRFRRCFSKNKMANKVIAKLNKVIVSDPDTTDATMAFLLYPAIKWQIQAQQVDAVMANICKRDPEMKRLASVQKVLQAATGESPILLLQKRQEHFEACKTLLDIVDTIIFDCSQDPDMGDMFYDILKVLCGDETIEISAYKIDRFTGPLFTFISRKYGNRLEVCLDDLLREDVFDDQEMAFLYHNTEMLLHEYNRIAFRANISSDPALKLLSCGTETDMLKITEKDSKYLQAYLLVEFMKLINGAIEVVKSYPMNGRELHRVLKQHMLADERNHPDYWAAKSLNYAPCTYYRKKTNALAVLASLLFGCDCDVFVKMMIL